jgi:hypothetical protein
MMDSDLKRLFTELAESGLRVDRQIDRVDRQLEAVDRQLESIREKQSETDRQMNKVFQQMAESSRRVDQQLDRVDLQLAELGVQLGGIGNKFGSFTEGLVWSSLRRILFEKFRMDFVAPAPQRRKREDGRNLEADMLGWTNGTDNRVIVVEIKSQLGVRDLDQLDAILLRLGEFFPEHRGKTAEGMIAAVGITEPMESLVHQRGFHLAKASDDNFELADPVGFQPRRVRV